MGAKRFEELTCWQLSVELKCALYERFETPTVRADARFYHQIRESARSAPANIAEGFARFQPGDFARFLEIARGSLAETQNHLRDARDLSYITTADYTTLLALSDRAIGATTRLIVYLKTRTKPRSKKG